VSRQHTRVRYVDSHVGLNQAERADAAHEGGVDPRLWMVDGPDLPDRRLVALRPDQRQDGIHYYGRWWATRRPRHRASSTFAGGP